MKVLVYLLLAGAVVTYAMPAINVNLPPLVTESYSPYEMTKSLPKAVTQKKTKWPRIKLDHDFIDVLLRLLPQPDNQDPKKYSLPFILGILVPVSLILTYVIAIFGFLILYAGREGTMQFFASLGVLTSGYALAGTWYLAKRAQEVFQNSVTDASGQFLGVITKNLVQKISIQADQGLYVLFGIMLATFAVQSIRKK